MKKRIQTMIIFAAMICMSISGCSERTVTPKSTSVTEPIVKTSVTSVTTVTTEAPVTEVTEKFTIPSTVVETTKSVTEVVAVTRLTAPQTETPKVNEEPTEYYKPIETTVKEITDDTKLTHAEFSTEENMQRLTSELNSYYQQTCMTLDTTLNTGNCGWMFAYQGEIDKTSVRSYNEHWERIVIGMDEQIAALNDMYNVTSFEGIRFHYYAELQADGEYHIYYCYQ